MVASRSRRVIRRTLCRLLTVAALVTATGAWAGWVFMHTAADPGRSAQVARAVLADPAARQEVAADVSSAVAAAANRAIVELSGGTAPISIDGNDPQFKAAVAAALADPRLAGTMADLVAATQAQALGLAPTSTIVIDPEVATAAVQRYLAANAPELAGQVPTLPAISVTLPAVNVPVAAQVRRRAAASVAPLAVVAAALLGLAFVLGGRPQVLRAAGIWAACAGASWLVLPHVAAWAAHQWVPGHAALVRAGLSGLAGATPLVVVVLLVGGAAAVVGSIPWSIAARRPAVSRVT